MTLLARAPGPCWGVDTSAGVWAAAAQALSVYRVQTSSGAQSFVRVLLQYGPHSEMAPAAGDLTQERLRAQTAAGLYVGLVQHVRLPDRGRTGWVASDARGKADGERIVSYAEAIGYPEGAAVTLDLENVVNPGQGAVDHAAIWREIVAKRNQPVGYQGFASGLTVAQWNVSGLLVHNDFASVRAVPACGLIAKQHPETTIALATGPLRVDIDEFFEHDALGRVLLLAFEDGTAAETDDQRKNVATAIDETFDPATADTLPPSPPSGSGGSAGGAPDAA